VMAGPKRTWKFYNAPEHEWMLGSPHRLCGQPSIHSCSGAL
ncbi:MAG: hypothetical protein EOP24_28480, partial [Hyphomicrobiales bacterium]